MEIDRKRGMGCDPKEGFGYRLIALIEKSSQWRKKPGSWDGKKEKRYAEGDAKGKEEIVEDAKEGEALEEEKASGNDDDMNT